MPFYMAPTAVGPLIPGIDMTFNGIRSHEHQLRPWLLAWPSSPALSRTTRWFQVTLNPAWPCFGPDPRHPCGHWLHHRPPDINTDPDYGPSDSRTLNVTMAPDRYGFHSGPQTPAWRPRLQASAQPSVATRVTDITLCPLSCFRASDQDWLLAVAQAQK